MNCSKVVSKTLAEIAAKVTEVLAELILMAPSDEQSTLMADMLEETISESHRTAEDD
jgi:hypothetical protein